MPNRRKDAAGGWMIRGMLCPPLNTDREKLTPLSPNHPECATHHTGTDIAHVDVVVGKPGTNRTEPLAGETFVYIGTDDGDFELARDAEPTFDDLAPTRCFHRPPVMLPPAAPLTVTPPTVTPPSRMENTVVRLMTPLRKVEETQIRPCPGTTMPPSRRPPKQRFLPDEEVTTRPPRLARGTNYPNKIGHYRIVRKIAAGGMGIVYEAEHESLGRRVAIKTLRRSILRDDEMVRRFLGEAIAAARIRHSGVVTVYDFGNLPDGTTYLVMEYLEGETLSRAMSEGEAMTIERVVELGRQIATTLAHAHAAGIVHRDLKPDNIHVLKDPLTGTERTKLLDFGVAKFVQQQLLTSMQTGLGKILGTPWYMPPEQCQGSGNIDARSDIYSLGCVLFQMACGRVPFPGKLTEVLTAHKMSAVPSVRAINPALPKSFDRLIRSMMAKDPRQRPQTMKEVERALRKLDLTSEQLESTAPKSIPPMAMPQTISRESTDRLPVPRRLKSRRRTSRVWIFGLAVAVLIAVGTVLGTGAY